MRLIDAEFLTETIAARIKPDGHEMTNKFMQKFIDVIKAMPTVDAEPVIRCEKCIHHEGLNAMEKFQYGSNVVWCKIPHFGGVLMKNDAFCSYGERKDGE